MKEANSLKSSVAHIGSKYPKIDAAFSYIEELRTDVQFLSNSLRQVLSNNKRAESTTPKPRPQSAHLPTLLNLKDPVSIRSLFAPTTSTDAEPKAKDMLKDPNSLADIFGSVEKSNDKTAKPAAADVTVKSETTKNSEDKKIFGSDTSIDDQQEDDDEGGDDDADDDHTIDDLQQQILEKKKRQQLRNNEVNLLNPASRLDRQSHYGFWYI